MYKRQRPLAAEVGLLPRVHGSGMFTRGQTQVLTVATLGSMRDNQLLDGIDEEENKRYIHHYLSLIHILEPEGEPSQEAASQEEEE